MPITFPGGVYPTMLTPFTENNKVDYNSLGKLIDWYLEQGSDGLFAVCQSSEMFYLSLAERVKIAKFVKEHAGSKCPVVCSGHISYSLDDQAEEIEEIANTGVDAVILVTNRLATASESDDAWIENLSKLMDKIPKDICLGFYECPYPYKRVMTPKTVRFCADSGRFYFLKDTCCDAAMIKERLSITNGSKMKIFNANTATLLQTLQYGAAGYSGVMANFQTREYKWLYKNYKEKAESANEVSSFLTLSSFIEAHLYPAIAKHCLMEKGILATDRCRTCDAAQLTPTNIAEYKQLLFLTNAIDQKFGI
jgi:4-hydroxy-tetrahydrodipicolinate synthase